jgi:hemerythrin-like domain-containing protein
VATAISQADVIARLERERDEARALLTERGEVLQIVKAQAEASQERAKELQQEFTDLRAKMNREMTP